MTEHVDLYTKASIELAGCFDQPLAMTGLKELHPKIKALKTYMKNHVKEDEIEMFISFIQQNFKWFPKIAEIEELRKENPAVAAERAWQSLLNKSDGFDVMITDPVACFVVSGYGSWYHFCLERDGNTEWTHKTFADRYIQFFKSGKTFQPRLLLGAWAYHPDIRYSPRPENLKIIGDQAEGMKILSSMPDKNKQIENIAGLTFKRVS